MAKGSGGTRGSSPKRSYPKTSNYNLRTKPEILSAYNVSERDLNAFAAQQEAILEKQGYTIRSLNLTFESEDYNEYVVRFRDKDGELGSMTRTIGKDSNGKLYVEHDYLRLPDADRGKGTARQLLANQLPLWKKMGVSYIKVHADISNGSYTWARFGFRMDRASYEKFIKNFQNHGLREIADAMRREKSYADGSRYVNIRNITELKMRDGTPMKEKMKPLMMNEHWYGHVDLTNKEDYNYYKKYVNSK